MSSVGIAANDGCHLAFHSSLALDDKLASDPRSQKLILLIHGFSGSSLYFRRNIAELSEQLWVIAVDLRGHGNSGRTKGGFHVARLSADLQEVVRHVRSFAPDVKIVPVGCSIGAAVLWTYVELYSDADFAGMVFVDQAPLQDRSTFGDWDRSKAHTGCYNEETLLNAQKIWIHEPELAYKGLVAECLGYRHRPSPLDHVDEMQAKSDEDFFISQSRRCDATWLAKLLADHTRLDHRDSCEAIRVPSMVMAGKRTACFPLDGMEETVRRIDQGRASRGIPSHSAIWVEFDSGHWLFWEEPTRFNEEISSFVKVI